MVLTLLGSRVLHGCPLALRGSNPKDASAVVAEAGVGTQCCLLSSRAPKDVWQVQSLTSRKRMALSVGDIQGKEKTWRPGSVSKGCPQDSRHCGY